MLRRDIMAIYGIGYINESSENNDLKNTIDKYKNDIKENANKICRDLFKNQQYKNSDITKCPSFGSVKLMDGYYWILLKNITNDAYSSGIGLDFERDVARSLNGSKLGDTFRFITEDYPGILIELR